LLSGVSARNAVTSTVAGSAGAIPTTTPVVEPGGYWISPSSGTRLDVTSDAIVFVALAFPTGPRDPKVERVEVTVKWIARDTGYTLACTADKPVQEVVFPTTQGYASNIIKPGDPRFTVTTGDGMTRITTSQNFLYACAWTISDARSWPDLAYPFDEEVLVTFNVFDVTGRENDAPNGSRTFRVVYRRP
jgi:hypothetical protein